MQSRCDALYNPSKQLAINEAMTKFQGRSSLKQYMPQKPIKRGIKVWVLAESTNGFFSRLEVYTGKRGLGRVVKDLSCDFQGKFYTSTIFSHQRDFCVISSLLERMDVVQLGETGKDFQLS